MATGSGAFDSLAELPEKSSETPRQARLRAPRGSSIQVALHSAQRLLSGIFDVLYPACCAVCSAPLRPAPGTGRRSAVHPLCRSCCPWTAAEDFLAPGCRRCGTPLPDTDTRCLPCRLNPPPFVRLDSVFWYRSRTEAAMKAFKYRGGFSLGEVFGEMMYRRYTADTAFRDYFEVDLVLSMPTASESFLTRGYHQTALIARRFASLARLPFTLRGLRIANHRVPQASLHDRVSREANVRGVFAASSRIVTGRNLLLLDDVVTTGATLSSATEALLEGGAASVHVLTFCRSAAFFRYRLEGARLAAEAPQLPP